MKNTEATSKFSNNSKQRQDEMYARLADREAQIAKNHEMYLKVMAQFNKAAGR